MELHISTPKTSVKSVTKRDGTYQAIDTMKIYARLEALSFGLDMKYVNLELVVNKVIEGMYDGVKTSVLDELAAETCAYMVHPPLILRTSSIRITPCWRPASPSTTSTSSQPAP
jgi:ribonucleoside-diphosphate reductase alpha chain